MAVGYRLVLLVLASMSPYVECCTSSSDYSTDHHLLTLNRSSFPAGFVFGAASSPYQYEGAVQVDGRKPSIWDTFVRQYPEKIADQSTGNVADKFYYQYKEDIAFMKEIGLDSFRFSISWPRILPEGKISGGVNQKGVDFYNFLIDELLSHGIQPFVTLFHWDLPQALEDDYGGFLSSKIVDDYRDYTDFCFKEFGDRVKYWVTINEPNVFADFGYARGTLAPGRCSAGIGNCSAGDSSTEPYIVAHNMILSHAAAVNVYRKKYQASQKGVVGITTDTFWAEPKYPTCSCRNASGRALDFAFGWIVHPITYGDYPETMRELVGDRLPKFTGEEAKLVKGSIDFVGVNYYTARFAEDATSSSSPTILTYTTDSRVNLTMERNGIPIGEQTADSWLYICPKGIRDLTLYVKREYNNPPIIITENGMADANNGTLPLDAALNDSLRIKFHYLYLSCLLEAIKDGVDIRGYYLWSFLDDFEWKDGYTVRFGINYVDYKNGLKRYPKKSSFWFRNFLLSQNLTGTSSNNINDGGVNDGSVSIT